MLAITALLFMHWLGDFVLQRHAWSMAKSKSNLALSKHVGTYALTLFALVAIFLGPLHALYFALFNGVTHWLVDYVTSRVNSRLWAAERVHDFFVSVGFDQFLHYVLLFGSYYYLTSL